MKLARTSCAFIVGVLLLFSWGEAAGKDPASILVVGWFSKDSYAPKLSRLSKHLVAYGLIEGRDYAFDYCQVRSDADLRAALEKRPVPFMVFSANTSPGHFVQRSGLAVPHVFQTYSDPVADGLVASYARPGGLRTGVVEFAPIHEKRLDLLLDLVPSARRIAVLVEASSGSQFLDEGLDRFARARPSVSITRMAIARSDTAADVASRLRRARVDVAYVPLEGEIDRVSDAVFAGLREARIPTMSEAKRDIAKGAILALEVDREKDVLQRVAHQIALVLLGAPPRTIPVQSPRKFNLTVNLDAARAMGIEVPRLLLRKAEFIVAHGQ